MVGKIISSCILAAGVSGLQRDPRRAKKHHYGDMVSRKATPHAKFSTPPGGGKGGRRVVAPKSMKISRARIGTWDDFETLLPTQDSSTFQRVVDYVSNNLASSVADWFGPAVPEATLNVPNATPTVSPRGSQVIDRKIATGVAAITAAGVGGTIVAGIMSMFHGHGEAATAQKAVVVYTTADDDSQCPVFDGWMDDMDALIRCDYKNGCGQFLRCGYQHNIGNAIKFMHYPTFIMLDPVRSNEYDWDLYINGVYVDVTQQQSINARRGFVMSIAGDMLQSEVSAQSCREGINIWSRDPPSLTSGYCPRIEFFNWNQMMVSYSFNRNGQRYYARTQLFEGAVDDMLYAAPCHFVMSAEAVHVKRGPLQVSMAVERKGGLHYIVHSFYFNDSPAENDLAPRTPNGVRSVSCDVDIPVVPEGLGNICYCSGETLCTFDDLIGQNTGLRIQGQEFSYVEADHLPKDANKVSLRLSRPSNGPRPVRKPYNVSNSSFVGPQLAIVTASALFTGALVAAGMSDSSDSSTSSTSSTSSWVFCSGLCLPSCGHTGVLPSDNGKTLSGENWYYWQQFSKGHANTSQEMPSLNPMSSQCDPCPYEIYVGQHVRINNDGPDHGLHGVVVYVSDGVFQVKVENSRVVVDLSKRDLDKLWHVCVVSGGVCQELSELADISKALAEPPLVVWQARQCQCGSPNFAQQANAPFLPEGTHFRWQDQTQAATLIRDIALHYSTATPPLFNLCKNYFELRSGTFRADTWRIAVLLRYGGLYFDDKYILKFPAEKLVDLTVPDLAWALKETKYKGDPAVHNGALYASRPDLPFFRCVLERQVDNIDRRRQPQTSEHAIMKYNNILSITGPSALAQALEDFKNGKCGAEHEVQHHGILGSSACWGSEDMCLGDDKNVYLMGSAELHRSNFAIFPRYEGLYLAGLSYCSTPLNRTLLGEGDDVKDGCYSPHIDQSLAQGEPQGHFGLSASEHVQFVQEFCDAGGR